MTKFRFTNPLILLILLSLPCCACIPQEDCTFGSQSNSAGPAIPDGFGVNIHFTNPQPGEIKMLSEAGLRWVRMDLKWDSTETQPGSYDFSEYDRLMDALKAFNIRALFILDYGNPLYDNGAPPRTEAARQAFTRWALAAARHFSGHEVIWEIYNEPNHSLFWPPKPNAYEYAALALAVGRSFRESVPNEKLIGPATSEIDFNFLEICFKAGLLEYWSAVSIHPYRRNDPETAAQDYCRLREMIRAYAPREVQSPKSKTQNPGAAGSGSLGASKEIPIISSEWGYSAAWPSMTEEKQAQLLARSWLTNVANNIPLSIWYDWRDDGLDPKEAEHHFGTVSHSYHEGREPVYDPKPAYLAAKTLTSTFNGYRFEKRLDIGDDQDYVLLFRNGVELRVATWTTRGSHNVIIPLHAGRYRSTKHTGETIGVIASGQNGMGITLSTAPVYLRQ
jgi:hypothetical protein